MKKGIGGFTITELIVSIAILSVLGGMAGISLHEWQNQYQAESQIRQMHADMLKTRVRAFEFNKRHFVLIQTDNYHIFEDTNDSGGSVPDEGDKPLWTTPKQLRYRCQWTGSIVVSGRGTMSTHRGGILSSSPVTLKFDTLSEPEYNCISIGPTRILAGKLNGQKCLSR